MKRRKTQKRIAILRELAELDLTSRQVRKLLRVNVPQTLSRWSKEAGVKFAYDRAGWQPVISKSRKRAEEMAALYKSGWTLQQIGDAYGLTRERVRQLVTRHCGLRRNDGGQRRQSEDRQAKVKARRNAQAMNKHGCTWGQYVFLREMKFPTRSFAQQRANAHRRGIEWNLTLWAWWSVWQESGHWEDRGRGSGYCMCRRGDSGAYEVGNVYIATGAQNAHDYQKRNPNWSGLPMGVTRRGRMYRATRMIEGKVVRIGTFKTAAQAHAAYLSAETHAESAA